MKRFLISAVLCSLFSLAQAGNEVTLVNQVISQNCDTMSKILYCFKDGGHKVIDPKWATTSGRYDDSACYYGGVVMNMCVDHHTG